MSTIETSHVDYLLNSIFGLQDPPKFPRALPADDGKMDKVLSTYCKKHNAEVGHACFELEGSVTQQRFYHVCNSRAKRAGFHGRIHESSLTFRGKGKKVARRGRK